MTLGQHCQPKRRLEAWSKFVEYDVEERKAYRENLTKSHGEKMSML